MYKTFTQLSLLAFLFVNTSLTFAKEGGNAWQSLFPGVPAITQNEIDTKKDELVFVDVRAKFLFDQKHKEGVEHISFSSRMFMISMESLIEKNQGKTIVVYCDSNNCIKSYRAVEKCIKADLKNVVIFDRNEELAKLEQDSVYTQLNLNQF
jgi:rhodanese-related sulfurtransferase